MGRTRVRHLRIAGHLAPPFSAFEHYARLPVLGPEVGGLCKETVKALRYKEHSSRKFAGGAVSKGSAIRRVPAACGIDLKHVGDSGNDLSALRIVGYPIAMGNADRDVLAAAIQTVGHADEGGLAEALQLALCRC